MREDYPEATIGAFILNRKGEVLLLKSKKWNGNYTIPAGHVEKGEYLENTVRREVREETGLDVDNIIPLIVLERILDKGEFHRQGHFICHNYVCEALSEEVRLNDEAESFDWVPPENVLDMNNVDSITMETVQKFCEIYGSSEKGDVLPGIYQHYKGDRYEVTGVARHSETLGKLVVYKGLYDHPQFGENPLFVRPAKMFAENVDVGGKMVPRFKKVE